MDLNEEFKRLCDLSGWNNVRISEAMGLTAAYIGQVRNGDGNIAETHVKHLRRILADEGIEKASTGIMRENAPPSELEIWKRRARDAETRLNHVRNSLRRALEESNPSTPAEQGTSSAPRSLTGKTAAALLGGKKHHEK